MLLRIGLLGLIFLVALGWTAPSSEELPAGSLPPTIADPSTTLSEEALASADLPVAALVLTPEATPSPGPEPAGELSPTDSPLLTASLTPTPPQPAATAGPTVTSRGAVVEVDGRARSGVPILMYHYIRVNPNPSDALGASLSVSPADFEAQMAFLAARGYRSILMRDLASEVPRPMAGRLVAITFDDGYADAYLEAYSALRRYGFQATFYVITGLVGRPSYLTWEQVRALADGGMAIGSHTVSHPDLTRLGGISLRRELEDSRDELRRRLGRPVSDFCYPSGQRNPAVTLAVGKAGYRTAVTTRPGYASSGDDPLTLPRVRVRGGISLVEFAVALGEDHPSVANARPSASQPSPSPATPPQAASGQGSLRGR